MDFFNLEKQFSFYGAYHSNNVNKIIHVICVPAILWTSLVWLSNIPSIYSGKDIGFEIAIFYGLYYIVLEPHAGVSIIIFLFLLENNF